MPVAICEVVKCARVFILGPACSLLEYLLIPPTGRMRLTEYSEYNTKHLDYKELSTARETNNR